MVRLQFWRFETVEYLFNDSTPRSVLTQSGRICLGLMYGSNHHHDHVQSAQIFLALSCYPPIVHCFQQVFRFWWFYGISTFVGYLTPNPFLCKKSVLFQTIQFSVSTQFVKNHFYFKEFRSSGLHPVSAQSSCM